MESFRSAGVGFLRILFADSFFHCGILLRKAMTYFMMSSVKYLNGNTLPPRIAVFSFTRDRVEYSNICFNNFHEKAGYPFEHYILDNGSQDGTVDWITSMPFHTIVLQPHNRGLSLGSNKLLTLILQEDYDIIVKIDNDCFVHTPDILKTFAVMCGDPETERWVLAPRVVNVVQIPRNCTYQLAGHPVGEPDQIGGLFQVCRAEIYREFMRDGGHDVTLPMACGQDEQFYAWCKQHGYQIGFVEDLHVDHYRTGERDYPEYEQRKWVKERKEPYVQPVA
jgi:glycosyltransferase involved in cell wall biosynthesis